MSERLTLSFGALCVGLCVVALSLPACGDESSSDGCSSDAQCPLGLSCLDGICIRPSGCNNNTDCDPGTFCDTTTGDCLNQGSCAVDIHCGIGQVCCTSGEQCQARTCVEGCRDSSDCPLGAACDRRNGGTIGSCASGLCEDDSFCCYGERCNRNNGACEAATDQPYCQACTPRTRITDPLPCGQGTNFCLVNTVPGQGSENFCGIDCTQSGTCPNGFQCGPVLTVAGTCRNDAECAAFGVNCSIGEGADLGFCPCRQDSDCNQIQNFCDSTNGVCTATGKPCRLNLDCLNETISCVNGGCVTGQNCAPLQGLTCAAILAGGGGPPRGDGPMCVR